MNEYKRDIEREKERKKDERSKVSIFLVIDGLEVC